MITDPLRGVSDATIELAAIWFLLGWVLGFAFPLTLWWRPITRARYEARERRRLAMQLEDSDKQLTAALAQSNRMAEMLARQVQHTDDQGRLA